MVAIFGHRGARGLLPENTLAGFALASQMQLTGVEFDIGMTRDGVVVVHHDPRLNPNITRDQSGNFIGPQTPLLKSLSYAQLNAYDVGRIRAGSAYAQRFATQQPVAGARIPTLDEMLQACQGLDLLVEVKTFPDKPDDTLPVRDLVAATIASLQAHNVLDQSVLYAFDWRVLDEAATIAPNLRRCCLTEAETVRDAHLWFGKTKLEAFDLSQPGCLVRAVASTGAKVWAPDHATLTASDVQQAHELGLLVIPWTVNEPEDILSMFMLEVDGLISDFPDRALQLLQERGQQAASPGFIAKRAPLIRT